MKFLLLFLSFTLLYSATRSQTRIVFNNASKDFQAGRYNRAIAQFEVVAHSGFPEQEPFGWFNLGQCLVKLNKLAEARSAFLRVLDLAPKMHKARQALGVVALKIGDPATARTHFQRLLEAGDSTAWLGLAEASWIAKDWPGSLQAYGQVLRQDSNNVQTWFSIADSKEQMHDTQGALQTLLEAQSYMQWTGIGLTLRLARLYDALNKKEKALTLLEKSLLYEPDNITLRLALANRYEEDNKRWMAVFTLEHAIPFDKKGRISLQLGHLLFKMKQYPEAFVLYQKAHQQKHPSGKQYAQNAINAIFNTGNLSLSEQLTQSLHN